MLVNLDIDYKPGVSPVIRYAMWISKMQKGMTWTQYGSGRGNAFVKWDCSMAELEQMESKKPFFLYIFVYYMHIR